VSLVLDASIALAWCFRDEGGDLALEVLGRLREEEDAFVPTLWTLEVANGLLVAERRGRITPPAVVQGMDLILALPIAVDTAERERHFSATWRLARTHTLSSYDAAYLELALRMRLPLFTLDERLRAAAAREGVG